MAKVPEVWLVNDDPAQLLVQKRLLGRFAATVWEFSSPVEAVNQAKNFGSCPYLVSDIQMPGMTGLELARVWCELHPDARVLLTSASPLSAKELDEATFLPRSHVQILTSYRLPELISTAQEWFGADSEQLEPTGEPVTSLLKFFDGEVHSKLRLLGGVDFLVKALNRFADRAPERIEGCREATRRGDFDKVLREAHSFKGSCGIVGATPLFNALDRIETAAGGQTEAGLLLKDIDSMEVLWLKTKEELKPLLKSLQTGQA